MDRTEKRALGVAALLGSGLFTLWIFALLYGHSSWLSWTVLACAVVALAGIGPAAASEMFGIGTWPFVGTVLLAAWLFGLAVNATPWIVWLTFAFGCAFVTLSFAFTVASERSGPLHHQHRHLHGHA
ncbi:MAG TPA: hypothetical protein VN853_03545 [Polyangia bacterium]|jgi:hypothetical protein|nr:hypothetical protein [Polyangia bacterium]